MDEFVKETVRRYDLQLISYSGAGFAQGLQRCVDTYGAKAFVLGTRKTDPNAVGQEAFSPSSEWLPPFMRVSCLCTDCIPLNECRPPRLRSECTLRYHGAPSEALAAAAHGQERAPLL